MKNIITLILLFLGLQFSYAAKVDTVTVHSKAMSKGVKAVVIQPDKPINSTLPTLYLLHGYSGSHADWVTKVPAIKNLVDQYQIVVVCPDGGYGSWYWDSPIDKNFQYETFVAKELVNYIEQNYGVAKDRKKRGITGLSMGGHGAMYLAIKNQDVFSAVGSTAGGVDIRPFPNNWDMAARLGEYSENKEVWDNHSVMHLTYLIKPNSLAIFIDCGVDDFFYGVNEKLHQELSYLKIPHRYLSMPGGHTYDYWSTSILYQMAFFNDYFSKSSK